MATKKGNKAGAPSGRQRVYALWDALADFPAAQTDAALDHLMREICAWLDADNAFWVGGVRIATGAAAKKDPQHGWRGRAVRHLHAPPVPDLAKLGIRGQENDPGMTTCAAMAEAGRFRTFRLHDGFVDFAAFKRTAHYQVFFKDAGISDRMWILCPVTSDAEACYVFDRYRTRRRFTKDDEALVGEALRGLKRLHRDVMLSYGLLTARTALSPTQRRLLAELLTDKTEKQIATSLGLTPGTTHQYVVALCRQLGVNGRAGLVAAWLGRPSPTTTDQ